MNNDTSFITNLEKTSLKMGSPSMPFPTAAIFRSALRRSGNGCGDNGGSRDRHRNSKSRLRDILQSVHEVVQDGTPYSMADLEPTPIGPNTFTALGQHNPTSTIPAELLPSLFTVFNCKKRVPDGCTSKSPKAPTKRARLEDLSTPIAFMDDTIICDLGETQSAQSGSRFLQHQADQWKERFQNLIFFKMKHGHCLVPHTYPPNQQLAQWTKRQRYQHKLKMMGRHSTLTHERLEQLENIGFVWDSHKAAWYERFESLKKFYREYGHCNVPSKYYENKPLAIWVKCQRRQRKLFDRGENSAMTIERIEALNSLGFDWNPRNL